MNYELWEYLTVRVTHSKFYVLSRVENRLFEQKS